MLFLQLGMAIFCFSAFWGAVADKSLPETVRRAMVFTSSITIITLAFIVLFAGYIVL
jgi:hypothetical protein